jgi:hypothetical protein
MAAHVAVLGVVAMQSPQLRIPEEAGGPPTPIIPILILPKAPPSEPGGPPTPVQLHRRSPRHAQAPSPVAPLVTEAARETPARAAPSPALDRFRVLEEAPGPDLRATLRGRVGCANPSSARLSRAEREACEESFASGARDAPFTGLGLSRDKARALDQAAARREADYRYKRSEKLSRPREPGSQLEWDGYRGPPGQAEALAGELGNDRPKATKPF